MNQERGNFLFQSLLALGLVFAFIPFLSRQLLERNNDTRMHSVVHQVDVAQTAARIFLRENSKNIAYDKTVVTGDDFSDLLEPYGLPLGFVPRTALGQDIILVIDKTPESVSAYLDLKGGRLNRLQRAELVRRIGFYASDVEDGVRVGVDLAEVYSDIVRRNEPDLDNSGFLSNLDMGGFVLDDVGNMYASDGSFETVHVGTLGVLGYESGRKVRNDIKNMSATKTIFQSRDGETALTLTRGTLFVGDMSAKTLSMFGNGGNLLAETVSVYDFSMTAGRTGFTGPSDWNIRGSVVTDKISFSVERLDISSYLNTTRGQDVYIDAEELEYSSKSGIEVGTLYSSNITLRDQTSSSLSVGGTGAAILDIRPAGTTMLPDALVSDIDNQDFSIIAKPNSNDTDIIDCATVIKDLEGVYNDNSLSQYLICQYVFWQNIEKRIDIKQCLMAGRNDCM